MRSVSVRLNSASLASDMKVTSVISATNYVAAFISAVVASLIGFDWLTFFTPDQALKIVAGLNLLGILVKGWMTTAEQMAKSIAAGASPPAKTEGST